MRDDRAVTLHNKGLALAFGYGAPARNYKGTVYAGRAMEWAGSLEFEFPDTAEIISVYGCGFEGLEPAWFLFGFDMRLSWTMVERSGVPRQ